MCVFEFLSSQIFNFFKKVTNINRNPVNSSEISWNEFSKSNGIEIASKKKDKKVDAVISLSGAPIVDKSWTEKRKDEIYTSRVEMTKILVDKILESPESERPKTFIGSSAVGIYSQAPGSKKIFDETYDGPYSNAFESKLCQDWENQSLRLLLQESAVRRVIIRTSVVLGEDGGLIKKTLFPGGLFCLGKIGNGEQPFPWIHIYDLTKMFVFAIENNHVNGIMNGSAPEKVTQAEFTKKLTEISGRWPIPTPEFLIKAMFRERAVLLLEGSYVLPEPNTKKFGFEFEKPTLDSALKQIIKKE